MQPCILKESADLQAGYYLQTPHQQNTKLDFEFMASVPKLYDNYFPSKIDTESLITSFHNQPLIKGDAVHHFLYSFPPLCYIPHRFEIWISAVILTGLK